MTSPRVGIRQWWALTALAAADPSPLTITAVRKAVSVHRAADPAADVTSSIRYKGLAYCDAPGRCDEPGHKCLLRLTVKGWGARLSAAGRQRARALA